MTKTKAILLGAVAAAAVLVMVKAASVATPAAPLPSSGAADRTYGVLLRPLMRGQLEVHLVQCFPTSDSGSIQSRPFCIDMGALDQAGELETTQ